MPPRPRVHTDAQSCVEAVIAQVGKEIRLGLPLGLGKANSFANALYRRAVEDPVIRLEIYTALTLDRPRGSSDLERRFLGPLNDRLFADYPELDYSLALQRGALPANVTVHEFYFQPGRRLGQSHAQQQRLDSNYTHVVRDVAARDLNVLAQLVAPHPRGGRDTYSLSCNPDVTVDLLPVLEARRGENRPVAVVAEVNGNLPYMDHDAVVAAGTFDHVIEPPPPHFGLFPVPNPIVSLADHAAGLHASTLVRDGGTLQLGIGSFSDAVAHALLLRHRSPRVYRDALSRLRAAATSEVPGPFEKGLYGCSEMLVEGFLHLLDAGVLTREVYGHRALQALANAGGLGGEVSAELLRDLCATGHLNAVPSPADVRAFQRHGVFRKDLDFDDGAFVLPDGERLPARLDDPGCLTAIAERCLGERLEGGIAVHGGFFLGSGPFYRRLRELSEAERARINMTGVHFINQLYGDETLKALQRRAATFINNAMMVTLHGAVVSDALEDYRVVSGVGGQYDFIAMAHALAGARAVVVVNSTRTRKGRRRSNIVWEYGHVTVPGHLRDIVVTEYGIADLRGKTDREVIAALLNVADSAFQDELLDRAKTAGKIEADYRVPERFTRNTRESLAEALGPLEEAGHFPRFPFGTELSEEERALAVALKELKDSQSGLWNLIRLVLGTVSLRQTGERHRRCLARLGLDRPKGLTERLLRRVVIAALERTGSRL